GRRGGDLSRRRLARRRDRAPPLERLGRLSICRASTGRHAAVGIPRARRRNTNPRRCRLCAGTSRGGATLSLTVEARRVWSIWPTIRHTCKLVYNRATRQREPTLPQFSGQIAIVTGGAMGIGGATARRLAHDGAQVLIADIEDDAAAGNVQRIRA